MTLAGAESFLSGQVCASLTRVVVPRARHDDFADALAAAFSAIEVGDPFDSATQMGPLAMERQRDRVEHYIAKGVEQGATLVTGGGRPKHLNRGYYIKPTVFSGVTPDMRIAREETFGPVATLMPYDDLDEAVEIANDTDYGLSAVISGDPGKAAEIAPKLRAGMVAINNWGPAPGAPFGGYKQSGNGREGGLFGLKDFMEVKAISGLPA